MTIQNGRMATLISAYAPTMTNPDDVKDMSYVELDTFLTSVGRNDKQILFSDFNVRVSHDSSLCLWEGVTGRMEWAPATTIDYFFCRPAKHMP